MALTVALIGQTSWYSGQFAKALVTLGPSRAQLAGVATLGVGDDDLKRLSGSTAAEFAERYGTRTFAEAADLLDAAKPDLVLVTAPNLEKARYVEMALEAGADAYVSKPMAARMEDAARIRAAARKYPGRLVGSLDPARFATAIREGYRRVNAGEIGEPLTARVWIQHGAANPTASRKGNPESDDAQGGPAFSLGVYAADLLNWFLGAEERAAVRTYAECDNLNTRTGSYPWNDTYKAVVRYGAAGEAGGRVGSMDVIFSVPMPAPLWEIEVSGRDGMLRTNGGNYEGMIWRRAGLERPRIEPFSPTVDDTILGAIRHVLDAAEKREPFEMDAEASYRAVELCEAWRRSAETLQPVRLPL
jgi:predicted dehydrogenase